MTFAGVNLRTLGLPRTRCDHLTDRYDSGNGLDDIAISYHDIIMTRILADLPDEDTKWLDARAVEQGKSRDQIIHDAVRWNRERQEPIDANPR